MYAGMHVELCKCAYTWRCACDACSHTQTYAWMNMCTCTCKPASTSIHVFTCTYVLARTRAVTHACKRTHTCTWSSATVHNPPPAARVHTNVHRCVHKCACKPTSACTPVHARACTYTPAQACSQPTGTRGHPTPGGRSLGSCLPCLHLCPAEPPQLVTAMINVHCSVSPTPAPSGATPDTVSPPTPVAPTVWAAP